MSRIDTLHPFCFLSGAQLAELNEVLTERSFTGGEVIIEQGANDHDVYVVLEGRVEVLDPAGRRLKEPHFIEAGHYFGERASLFHGARLFELRAVGETVCAIIPGSHFLDLFSRSPAFAMAFSNILRDKQGLFTAFERFMAELLHGVSREHIDMVELIGHYRALRPALHRHIAEPEVIDFAGLSYAIRRLPENLTETFTFFLTDDLPVLYSRPENVFQLIEIPARRRTVYEMMPGKSIVLLRDGISDLVDFISLLCLFMVEARKLRKRIGTVQNLERLHRHLTDDNPEDGRGCIEAFPLTRDEIDALYSLWGEATPRRLHQILVHHEDFTVEIQKQLENYNSSHSEIWTVELARATDDLMGYYPASLPEHLPVHIVSSNTHSVSNCLSPFLVEERDAILAWGQEHRPEIVALDWEHDTDLIYGLARDYFRAHPEREVEREARERSCGIHRFDHSAFTGIAVELIDTGELRGYEIDPDIGFDDHDERALIVNIDYAFGQQAEEILSALLSLFGRNVKSINILGKAGALQGKRGDIMVATSFVEQSTDQLLTTPRPHAVNVERLRQRLPDRGLAEGPILTVTGTLMQNEVLLYFYRDLWRCIGLEMEGTYYLREVITALNTGVLPQPVDLRFLYYTSDLPLDHAANLSGSLRLSEGLPPLYACTREVLAAVFDDRV